MPSTISDPTMADNQADKDQNSVTPTLKMLCPIQPPTTAPSTPNSIGASQPPPRWPGLMVLAMAPAINPKNYPTDNAIHDDSFEARYLAMCKERFLLQTVQTVLTEITIAKALNHCGRTCHTSMVVLFSRDVSLGMGFSTFSLHARRCLQRLLSGTSARTE